MSKFYDWDDDEWERKPYTSGTYTPARREARWWSDSSVKETLAPKPRRSLSGFWSDRWHGWTVSSDVKYARIRALESVRRVGSIIFGAKRLLPFTWNSSHDREGVLLDDAPISSEEVSWEMDKRVDAVMGGALAEAARNMAESLIAPRSSPEAKQVSAVHRWLTGIAGVSKEFPGYRGYFTTNRDFFHNPRRRETTRDKNAAYLKQEPRSRAAALSAVVWNALQPEEPLETSPELEELTKRLGAELRTVHTLPNQRTRQAELLRIIKEIQQLPESERERDDRMEGSGDDPASRLGISENPTAGKRGLDKAEAARIEASVSEEERQEKDLEQKFPKLESKYNGVEIAVVSKLAEPVSSGRYQEIRSQVQPLIARTRAALSFRNEIARMDELGLRSGLLDENALASVALGSDRVFRRQEVVSAPSVHLGLLVDESGSMNGAGEHTARQCAVLIREAVHNLPGIAFSVWGHTGNQDPCRHGVVIRRYIERDNGDHERLAGIRGRSENIDGGAILYAGRRMLDLSRAGESRILFVLCDGYPHGFVMNSALSGGAAGYYGSDAVRHMRKVIDGVRAGGVQVFALGMGRGLTESYLSEAFGDSNWIFCKEASDTPQALARLLKKTLKTGSAR